MERYFPLIFLFWLPRAAGKTQKKHKNNPQYGILKEGKLYQERFAFQDFGEKILNVWKLKEKKARNVWHKKKFRTKLPSKKPPHIPNTVPFPLCFDGSLCVCMLAWPTDTQTIGKLTRNSISGDSMVSYPVLTFSQVEYDRQISTVSKPARRMLQQRGPQCFWGEWTDKNPKPNGETPRSPLGKNGTDTSNFIFPFFCSGPCTPFKILPTITWGALHLAQNNIFESKLWCPTLVTDIEWQWCVKYYLHSNDTG